MAQKLAVIDRRAAKLSLPEAVTMRTKWLGVVEGKRYLSTGLEPLTDTERALITQQIGDIDRELHPLDGDDEKKTAMLAEMMIALAGGATDRVAVMSKQAAYRIALDGIPAWALRDALHQWYRGSVKALKVSSAEYQWPPAPGVLAIICRSLLQPYQDAIETMNSVLEAKPLDETIKLLHQKGAA